MTETGDAIDFRGIWLSAEWPLDDNEGAHGDVVLALDVPDELFREFEWVEEESTYRESMIPAARLSPYLASARVLAGDEVDEFDLPPLVRPARFRGVLSLVTRRTLAGQVSA